MTETCPTKKKSYPLHVHTTNSILDAVSTVGDYLDWCSKNKVAACSCTDHGYIGGHYDLLTLSRDRGIKPIPGVEIYLKPDDDYAFAEGQSHRLNYFHLTLWAGSKRGYQNLLALTNDSWAEGKVVSSFGNMKPRATWEDLRIYAEGIICGTGCLLGPVAYPMYRGERHEAIKSMERLSTIFSGRLFAEIMPTPSKEDWVKNSVIASLSDGTSFSFKPDDVLSTNLGEMTAKKAAETPGVSEIHGSVPDRFGLGRFLDSATSRRIVSVVLDDDDDY